MYRGLNRIDSFPSRLAVLQSLSVHAPNLATRVTDPLRVDVRAAADERAEPSKCVNTLNRHETHGASFIYTYRAQTLPRQLIQRRTDSRGS